MDSVRVVSRHICVANGSVSFVRSRRIPVVSALAAAIPEIALDIAADGLDCEHYPYLHHVAFARAWASLGTASCVGDAGGIWMRGSRCSADRFAPDKQIWRPCDAQWTGRVKLSMPLTIFYASNKRFSSFNKHAVYLSELSVKTGSHGGASNTLAT